MTNQNKSPLGPTSGQGTNNNQHPHPTRRQPKWKRTLAAMLTGKSFNRFEAERVLNDHCLHSTVSTIQAKGVMVERRDEVVPGFQGTPTHVCRYWLTDENRDRACQLLGLATWRTD